MYIYIKIITCFIYLKFYLLPTNLSLEPTPTHTVPTRLPTTTPGLCQRQLVLCDIPCNDALDLELTCEQMLQQLNIYNQTFR